MRACSGGPGSIVRLEVEDLTVAKVRDLRGRQRVVVPPRTPAQVGLLMAQWRWSFRPHDEVLPGIKDATVRFCPLLVNCSSYWTERSAAATLTSADDQGRQ
jgi:hypothetical protein